MSNSLFVFNFRLGPWEGCLNLNFDQVQLAPGFSAVCTRDQLEVLWRGEAKEIDIARGRAHVLVRTLIHAEAFLSFPLGIVLEVEPVTWLELRECTTSKVVTGYMHQTLAAVPLDPNHQDKRRLQSAAALTFALQKHAALGFAIGDFYTARREVGLYAAFYAFRVLEDIGFYFGTTKDGKPDWDAMNTALGTSKETWAPLTDAGTRARHLGGENRKTLQQINNMELMSLAREAVSLTLRKIGIAWSAEVPGPPEIVTVP